MPISIPSDANNDHAIATAALTSTPSMPTNYDTYILPVVLP